MKILFIGDYSNLHACLAARLRETGHDVTVVSDGGGFMKTPADHLIVRHSGIRGSFGYLYRIFSLLPLMRGYDHVQLINTNFLSLRPGKLKYIFDRLRANNGKIGLTLAGNDYWYVKACTDEIFPFSEYRIGSERTPYSKNNPEREREWLSAANKSWAGYLSDHTDYAMSVLPEYDIAARGVFGERLTFINLPVNIDSLPLRPLSGEGPLRVFIGMKRGSEEIKGTAQLLEVAKRLEREGEAKIKVDCVRSLPLADYLRSMSKADLVIDQLYGCSPATNSLQAMAMGKAVATGVQECYYDYQIGSDCRPLLSLDPRSDFEKTLRRAVSDTKMLRELGLQGRSLVELNNDVKIVAGRFLKAISQ